MSASANEQARVAMHIDTSVRATESIQHDESFDASFDAERSTSNLLSQTQELTFHPYANVFPLLEGKEREELIADVRAHGVREAIWVCGGQILDGRNRWLAAKAANVPCATREYQGDDPVSFVVSLNLQRRHLDESQRALVATELASLKRGANQHVGTPTLTQQRAAQLMSVSRDSVIQARKVRQAGAPELVAAAMRGDVSINAARELATLPQDLQAEIVAAGPGTMREVAASLRKPHVSHNSGNYEWYTPGRYIDIARTTMGGIDTDPASSDVANSIVGASRYFTQVQDGLQQQWTGRVWMNPPYAEGLVADFVEALVVKFDSGEVEQACVLVNNATETQWFQRLLRSASSLCLLQGRIKFLDKQGVEAKTPVQGQALLYLGKQVDRFVRACRGAGTVLSHEDGARWKSA